VAGDIIAGHIYRAFYRLGANEFILHEAPSAKGVLDAPASTRMYFNQAAAPTGWVKETNAAYDLSPTRVLSTSVFGDTGGSLLFGNAFAARTIALANLPAGWGDAPSARSKATPHLPVDSWGSAGGLRRRRRLARSSPVRLDCATRHRTRHFRRHKL
jgi:hypothetical protein